MSSVFIVYFLPDVMQGILTHRTADSAQIYFQQTEGMLLLVCSFVFHQTLFSTFFVTHV